MSTAVLTDRLLPQRVDNTYRGYKLAIWLFGAVVLMKLAMSLNSIFNGYVVASSADGIPVWSKYSIALKTTGCIGSFGERFFARYITIVRLVTSCYDGMLATRSPPPLRGKNS
jgi:hypothetical protein